jgi:glycine cleavage system regulatory protein
MVDYRAYIIGLDGHFYRSVSLDCVDDAAAVEQARQLLDGHDIELWQLDRKVIRFDHKPTDF